MSIRQHSSLINTPAIPSSLTHPRSILPGIVNPSIMTTGENIDFSDLETKYRVTLDEDFDNILIIDNLPKIDASKEEKLLGVLKKNLFGPVNAIPRDGGCLMPRDPETGISRGYLFIEFQTAEIAASVAKIANGYRLDKSHVLSALKFADFDGLKELPEEFVEPAVESFVEKEFLKSWLLDPKARDQFVTCSGNQTNIYYNNRSGAPEQTFSRASWTDGTVKWSPLGSFLCTFHGQGVALWGGASWTKLSRFPHTQVKGAFFSPQERFLVTQSAFNPSNPSDPNVFVWEVQTGKVLRAFIVEELTGEDLSALESRCVLQWSFDDSHASRVLSDHVAIYEVPSFALIDKKGLKVDGVREISWSPVDLNLVYWVPGNENTPSRVALWNLPTRQVVRTKNLFNVQEVSVHWQSEGEFLAIKVDRYAQKNKKNITSSIELFRLKVKDIPVEVIEAPGGGERVDHFSWEPLGTRFLTNQSFEFKSVVSIFNASAMIPGKGESVQLLKSLERKQLTRWSWSPRGEYFVLAGLDSTSAFLEFWSCTDFSCLAVKDHFMATDLEWDPSGRFVSSWVSYWRHQIDNGFMLWDFKGDLISKQNQPRFTAFAWRPRPRTLLSKPQIKEIKKNMKTLSARYESEDAQSQEQSTASASETRKRTLEEWVLYRVKCQAALEAKSKQREAILRTASAHAAAGGAHDTKIVQEWIEDEVIEEVSEEIKE